MEQLIDLLRSNARAPIEELARELGTTEEAVRQRMADLEKQGVIRGYQAVVDPDLAEEDEVRAIIELHVRPEPEGGFDKLARRIGRFDQVQSMFLISGGYDLLLFVKGHGLREVAQFVGSKLATMDGVVSTATHFMLKTYKDQGVLMENKYSDERLQVSP